MARRVADAWKTLSALDLQPPPSAELTGAVEKLIQRYELMPVVNWTYWCAPTALTMVLGFWDNYVRDKGSVLGFGRLIDYWLNHWNMGHPTYGNNIPNLMHKLIDPETGTWAGTSPQESIRTTTGYRFAFHSVEGTPSNELKAEIDNDRPVQWEIWPPAHSMAAFGYRITPFGKFVIVYNTYGTTPYEQRDEYEYSQYGVMTSTAVNSVVPEDTVTQDHLALLSPYGDETLCQWIPEELRWFVWGDAIKKVDLLSSSDRGVTWSLIASDVPTTPGGNAFLWRPTEKSARARIQVKGYKESGEYIAGDGSHSNFTVAGGPVVQVVGRVRLLKLPSSEATIGSLGVPAEAEATVVLDGRPELSLHVGLRHGPLAMVRRKILSILQEALDQNELVRIDFVEIVPTNGIILRASIERSG
jgi:hypothetical protein